MNILPLNNNLENKKKSTITLYVDCCCCCCCCVLAPLGSLSAEAIVKRKYSLTDSVLKRGLFNFLFFALAGGVVWLLSQLSEGLLRTCRGALCSSEPSVTSPFLSTEKIINSIFRVFSNNDFIIFASIGLLVYFFLLFFYSKSWMNEVTTQQRLKAVLFESILSLVFIFLFSVLSIPLALFFMSAFI